MRLLSLLSGGAYYWGALIIGSLRYSKCINNLWHRILLNRENLFDAIAIKWWLL